MIFNTKKILCLFGEGKSFSLGRSSNREKYFIKTTISWHTNISNTTSSIVIVDEIQKIPELLDEIHWLIENYQVRFILSGSSPRKLLRSSANLSGGRALRYELYPIIQSEIPEFNLLKALNNGLLPRHYLAEKPKKLISIRFKSNYTPKWSGSGKLQIR